jgi:hypothetical protein
MYFEIVRNPNLSDINGTFGEMYIDGEPFCATCRLLRMTSAHPCYIEASEPRPINSRNPPQR